MHKRNRNARGAAGQQYAIVVGLIAVIAIIAVTRVGSSVQALMGNVANKITNGGEVSVATPPAQPAPTPDLIATPIALSG